MSMRKRRERRDRYPLVNGKKAIEIRVKNLNQLFDERDPSPFIERDLDEDAVEYLVSSLQELNKSKVKRLLIFYHSVDHLDQAGILDKSKDTTDAIHKFFSYMSDRMEIKIRSILKNGFKAFLIGITFLSISVICSAIISNPNSLFWIDLLKEGLLLTGWVSMWKPINIFLYDWGSPLELKKIYDVLSKIEIDYINENIKK